MATNDDQHKTETGRAKRPIFGLVSAAVPDERQNLKNTVQIIMDETLIQVINRSMRTTTFLKRVSAIYCT